MKGYVYILRDKNGKFYVGSTEDVAGRLHQHNLGHTQTTARMKEARLVLSQEYGSLKIARRIELKIKKLKRRDYVEKMVRDGQIRLQ